MGAVLRDLAAQAEVTLKRHCRRSGGHRHSGSRNRAGTMGVNTIDGAIHEVVEKVAGKELRWDTGLMADMPDGIEEELKRKGIHVQYRDANLCRRRKPLCYPIDCDECEARKECSAS